MISFSVIHGENGFKQVNEPLLHSFFDAVWRYSAADLRPRSPTEAPESEVRIWWLLKYSQKYVSWNALNRWNYFII